VFIFKTNVLLLVLRILYLFNVIIIQVFLETNNYKFSACYTTHIHESFYITYQLCFSGISLFLSFIFSINHWNTCISIENYKAIYKYIQGNRNGHME